MRGMTILWTLLSAAVVIGLFMLKYQVQELEKELAGLNRKIYENQETIHVLKAEWTYLLDPTRLRELAERHLNMRSVQPNQLAAAFPGVPYAQPRAPYTLPQTEGVIALAETPTVVRSQPAPTETVRTQETTKSERPIVRREENRAKPPVVPAASAPTMLASRPQVQPVANNGVLVIKSPALRAAEAARGTR